MTNIIDIPETETQFQDEWLLFEVLETDDLEQPTKGRLLCHHPDRLVVHKRDMELRLPYTYTTFTGPVIPEGYEIVL